MEYLLLHDYRVHYNKHHERYCEQCVSVQDAWRTVIERFWSQIAIAALLTHDAYFWDQHPSDLCADGSNDCILP